MAKIIENPKGFKVIEVSFKECTSWGGFGICDNCNNAFNKAYYVAVLNRVFCEDCYLEWYLKATYYEEDREIEERNFQTYKRMLKI